MMTWNPEQYLRFDQHRLRPALELIQRIPLQTVENIIDLGCGTGNVTPLLKARWESAHIIGMDSSESMLARAQQDFPDAQWIQADIQTWSSNEPCDVLFSNAALHWLPHHEDLFPRLYAMVKTGGIFAIQMPNNFAAPSHTMMHQIAAHSQWSQPLENLLAKKPPVHNPTFYYDLLKPLSSNVEIWETEYWQVLTGTHAVAEWTKSTGLKPFLDALQEPDRSDFENQYRQSLATAYQQRADGTTLFPFKRLFIVAQKK
jgi:trans-aconitate 2-methyltransferase